MVIPWYPTMCAGTWFFFWLLQSVPFTPVDSACYDLDIVIGDAVPDGVWGLAWIWDWRAWMRPVASFFWLNTVRSVFCFLVSSLCPVFGGHSSTFILLQCLWLH